jgi:hypothetical protein
MANTTKYCSNNIKNNLYIRQIKTEIKSDCKVSSVNSVWEVLWPDDGKQSRKEVSWSFFVSRGEALSVSYVKKLNNNTFNIKKGGEK